MPDSDYNAAPQPDRSGPAPKIVTPSGVYSIVVTVGSTSGSQSLPYVLTVK